MPFDPINGLVPQVPLEDDGNIGTLPTVPAPVIAQAQSIPLQGGAKQDAYQPPAPMPDAPPPVRPPVVIPAGLESNIIPGVGQVDREYNQIPAFKPRLGSHQHIMDINSPESRRMVDYQNTLEFGPSIAAQYRQLDNQRAAQQAATTAPMPNPTTDGFNPIAGLVPKIAQAAVKPTEPTPAPVNQTSDVQTAPEGQTTTAADSIGQTDKAEQQKLEEWYQQHKKSYSDPDATAPTAASSTAPTNQQTTQDSTTQNTPNAVPPGQQPDNTGLRDFMEQRYRQQMTGLDNGMNAAQARLAQQAKGDKISDFISHVLIPGANMFSKNPFMPGALNRVSAGMQAQTAAHALERQKFAEMRMKQAEDAYKQLHETSVSDETARHNLASEEDNKVQRTETNRHNLAEEQDKAANREENIRHNKQVEEREDRRLAEEQRKNREDFEVKKAELIDKQKTGAITRKKMLAEIDNLKTVHDDKEKELQIKRDENARKAAEYMISLDQKNKEQETKDKAQEAKDKLARDEVHYDKNGKPVGRKYVAQGELPSEQPKEPQSSPLGNFLSGLIGGGRPATAAVKPSAPSTPDNPGGIVRPSGVKSLSSGPPPKAVQFYQSLPPERKAEAAQQFKQKYGMYPWEL